MRKFVVVLVFATLLFFGACGQIEEKEPVSNTGVAQAKADVKAGETVREWRSGCWGMA